MVGLLLAGETHVFVDVFEVANVLFYDPETILIRKVSLSTITNSESLLEIIFKSPSTTERHLPIYIELSLKAYFKSEI